MTSVCHDSVSQDDQSHCPIFTAHNAERASAYASQDYSKQTVYPLVDGNGTGNSRFVVVGSAGARRRSIAHSNG